MDGPKSIEYERMNPEDGEMNGTTLQAQSEVEHVTSRSRKLPRILNRYEAVRKN